MTDYTLTAHDKGMGFRITIPPRTELERARAHLLNMQRWYHDRRAQFARGQFSVPGPMIEAENAVLAALSWVWDAQQRETGRLREMWREAGGILFDGHGGPSYLQRMRQQYGDGL